MFPFWSWGSPRILSSNQELLVGLPINQPVEKGRLWMGVLGPWWGARSTAMVTTFIQFCDFQSIPTGDYPWNTHITLENTSSLCRPLKWSIGECPRFQGYCLIGCLVTRISQSLNFRIPDWKVKKFQAAELKLAVFCETLWNWGISWNFPKQ